jgi:hypothetical protein
MTNIFINPPKHLICHFCKQDIEGLHNTEIEVVYRCRRHEPLIYELCCHRVTKGVWTFNRVIIQLPLQLRLYWNFIGQEFELREWAKHSLRWSEVQKKFDADWILTQTPEKLLSLLQMYKTFS